MNPTPTLTASVWICIVVVLGIATAPADTNPPPPPTDCVALPAGLVAWWRGEGSAEDTAGAHHGTLVGNVTYAPGVVGQGFQFDGLGGYVRIPNDSSLDFANELTIELWYRHDGLPDDAYGLVSTRGPGLEPVNYAISVIPIGIGPYFNDPTVASGDDAVFGSAFEASRYLPIPPAGRFHHLAVTFRQANPTEVELKTFIDGALVRTLLLTAQLANAISDSPIVIGRSNESGGELFKGVIDEVGIYGRALSEAEVSAVARAGTAGRCPAPDLLARLVALVRGASASVNHEPLLATLDAVRASIARGNLRAAINQLRAFQHKVQAQVARLDAALAAQLIALAGQLIESLDLDGALREDLAALAGVPMRVERAFRVSGGGICVEARAIPGTACCVQTSTDLRDWVDMATPVEVADGLFQFLEAWAEEPARFYRLKAR